MQAWRGRIGTHSRVAVAGLTVAAGAGRPRGGCGGAARSGPAAGRHDRDRPRAGPWCTGAVPARGGPVGRRPGPAPATGLPADAHGPDGTLPTASASRRARGAATPLVNTWSPAVTRPGADRPTRDGPPAGAGHGPAPHDKRRDSRPQWRPQADAGHADALASRGPSRRRPAPQAGLLSLTTSLAMSGRPGRGTWCRPDGPHRPFQDTTAAPGAPPSRHRPPLRVGRPIAARRSWPRLAGPSAAPSWRSVAGSAWPSSPRRAFGAGPAGPLRPPTSTARLLAGNLPADDPEVERHPGVPASSRRSTTAGVASRSSGSGFTAPCSRGRRRRCRPTCWPWTPTTRSSSSSATSATTTPPSGPTSGRW